jgi:hypothetical protein
VPKREIDPKEIEAYLKKQKEIKDAKMKPSSENKTNDLGKIDSDQTQSLNTTELNETNIKQEIESGCKEKEKNSAITTTTNNISTTTNNNISTINTNLTNTSVKDIKSIENLNKTSTQPKVINPIPISTYNGDTCDNYNWSQGIHDVTIQIILPENTTKKNVKFKLKLF